MFKSCCDLENKVKCSKILSVFTIVTMIYLCNFEKNPPTSSKIFYLQAYDLETEVKVTKHLTYHKSVTMIYPGKSDEYQSNG